MTNREKLMNMSLYDLILSLAPEVCRLRVITRDITVYKRCPKYLNKDTFYVDCSKCIADWLNEEVQQDVAL